MNTMVLAAMGLGAVLGGAVARLIAQLVPATPALGPVLARLKPGTGQEEHHYVHPLRAAADTVAGWFKASEADLLVLGRSQQGYLKSLGVNALVGFVLPPAAGLLLGLVGLGLPFVLPALAGVALSAMLVISYVRGVKNRAARTRAEFRNGVAIYLNQVAGNVADGYGTVECLERATEHCYGAVFDLIRRTLNRARRQQEEPWQLLRDLGRQMEVPALGDVGDIMTSSGTQGTETYDTLRDSRASLRKQIRGSVMAHAVTATAKLGTIGALVLGVGLILGAYPLIVRMQL